MNTVGPADGRVAITALLLALGAADHELEPALRILRQHEVPDDLPDIAQQARDALALARMERS